ncbi:MAG TPA: hypothetical protein VJH90_00220 [archaeon]|nr:hypothetical protein [archaeon]
MKIVKWDGSIRYEAEIDLDALCRIADNAPLDRNFDAHYMGAVHHVQYDNLKAKGLGFLDAHGFPVKFEKGYKTAIEFRIHIQEDAREEFKREWIVHEIVEGNLISRQHLPGNYASCSPSGLPISHLIALDVEWLYAKERGFPFKLNKTGRMPESAKTLVKPLHHYDDDIMFWEKCKQCKDEGVVLAW